MSDATTNAVTDEARLLDDLFEELFPICRSITGPGLRKSLDVLSGVIPLEVEGVPSGTDVFDWTVPREWRIQEAWLEGPDGERYADFSETNLAVVNYSEPVDERLSRAELEPHLYSLPDLPSARPYVTSYYDRTWGFCLPHEEKKRLPDGQYHAHVDSEFVDGELNYGHAVLPGETDEEVLLSSYLCHPSLANNELSGPLVLAALYRRLADWEDRHFTYRFLLCPETIGSITYLSRYGDRLRDRLAGGMVLTCLGGPRDDLRYKRSRREDAHIDRTVDHLVEHDELDAKVRPFTPVSGSDERQFCSPGFDLPVGQMARTPYEEYDGYHNSLDTKEFMGIDRLVESVDAIERTLQAFELAGTYENRYPYGEPMLGKRDLYPSVNAGGIRPDDVQDFIHRELLLLNYCDGDTDMLDVAGRADRPLSDLRPVVDLLEEKDVLRRVD